MKRLKSSFRCRRTILILLSSFFFACTVKIPSKSDLPTWDVSVEIPIYSTVITVDSLLTDSLIAKVPIDENGNAIFAYRDTFEINRVEVGEQLDIGDIQHSYSQSIEDVTVDSSKDSFTSRFKDTGVKPVNSSDSTAIGAIELEDVEPDSTEPFLFREVMPGDVVTQLEGLINDGGGSASVDSIGSADLEPNYKSFSFDNFKSADFISGVLKVEIVNNMIITLGSPINVGIMEVTGNDSVEVISVIWNEEIPPGESSVKSIDLAGKTLPGNVLIKVSGHTVGTKNQPITITNDDLNSNFYVVVSASDLEVSRATARIPEQIVDDAGVIKLPEQENKVRQAKVEKGSFKVGIKNYLPVDSDILVTVNSIKDLSGNPWQFSIDVPADGSVDSIFAIDGYTLEMGIVEQEISYSYEVRTYDTGDEYRTVDMNDYVKVDFDIYGKSEEEDITFSEFTGIIKAQEIREEGEINVNSEDADIVSAVISSGAITLRIHDGVNMDNNDIPHVIVRIPEIYQSEGSDISLIEEFDIYSGDNERVIDLSGKEIRLPKDTQKIHYNCVVTTQGDVEASYDLLDSIVVEISVSELAFEKVRGYFYKEAITKEDYIELKEDTKVEEAEISEGMLTLNVVNNIGMIANVEFVVNEIAKDENKLSIRFQIPSTPEPFKFEFPLNGYVIKMSKDNQKISYRSSIILPQDSLMTLRFGQDVNIDVNLEGVKFERVKGYIDTVVVNIDTVEQRIDALPEELEGVEFSDVELNLKFNTNIGVPVILDLTVQAENKDGEQIIKRVRQNIVENNVVKIPDAEDIFNIFPDRIVAFGQAKVGGDGTVSVDQYVEGKLTVEVPMSFIIDDDVTYESEAQTLEEDIPDQLKAVKLFYEYLNQMEFGARVDLLVARDTTYFNKETLSPDTLATITLFPDTSFTDSTFVDEGKIELLQDSVYIKPVFTFLGMRDENGNPVPSRLLSSDSLSITIYGRIYGEINPGELAGEK